MDKETEVWFAMRATYRRELEAMHLAVSFPCNIR